MAQGIGPGTDGLGLQRFQREGIAHLIGNDALQVGFQGKRQDGLDRAVLDGEFQVSGIDAGLEVKADTGFDIAVLAAQEGKLLAGGQGKTVVEKDQLSFSQEHGDLCPRRQQDFHPVRAAGEIPAFQRHPGFIRQIQAGKQYPDV